MKPRIFLLGLCFFISAQGHALELSYDRQDTVSVLLNEALQALPTLVHERLREDRITIRLVSMPLAQVARLEKSRPVISLHSAIAARSYTELSSQTPASWFGSDQKFKLTTRHPDLHRFLLGEILREILRYYDQRGFAHTEYLRTRRQCVYGAVLNDPATDPECRMIQGITRTVSDSPEFLQLAGFQTGPEESTNTDPGRSPDAREFASAEEAFTVNMEFFLLDPEFQCRRPLIQDYFVEHFRMNPFPRAACQTAGRVVVQKSSPSSFSDQWEDLDLSRLYQIHYLWAGPGQESFSRFGHSMLRLVFCAPNRNEVGPECLKDVYAHRVISFRAAVDDPEISSMKGLMGEYPSYLYFMTLSNVVQEYTRTELRKLYSLPLRLTGEEMKRVVLAALEEHWAYKGRYKFLSNNCAAETWNLLRMALVNHPKALAENVIRPDSLYRILIRIGLAESRYSLDRMERDFPQLVFQTQKRLLDRNLSVLHSAGVLPLKSTLEEYQKLSAVERGRIGQRLKEAPATPESRHALYAYLNLAEYSRDTFAMATVKAHLKDFSEFLAKDSKTSAIDQTQLGEFLKSMVSPKQLLSLGGSYGIPTEAELQSIRPEELENRFSEARDLIIQLLMRFKDFLPKAERERLEQEETNVQTARAGLSGGSLY